MARWMVPREIGSSNTLLLTPEEPPLLRQHHHPHLPLRPIQQEELTSSVFVLILSSRHIQRIEQELMAKRERGWCAPKRREPSCPRPLGMETSKLKLAGHLVGSCWVPSSWSRSIESLRC